MIVASQRSNNQKVSSKETTTRVAPIALAKRVIIGSSTGAAPHVWQVCKQLTTAYASQLEPHHPLITLQQWKKIAEVLSSTVSPPSHNE
jgi:hypothetical protein